MSTQPLLGVEALDVFYGRSQVLRSVSLEVRAGEVVCVMGRNGAGKTTLLRALMSVLPKPSGRVRFGGVDVTGMSTHQLARTGLAWLPQDDSVFPGLTVGEHLAIACGGRRDDQLVEGPLELFPLLRERLGQQASTLSGGERKMLGIIECLVRGPQLLLLDEPTEGLSPAMRDVLLAALARAAERHAIVLAEQNIDTALAVGSRAYVLERGTVVEQGDVAELHGSGVLERRLSL